MVKHEERLDSRQSPAPIRRRWRRYLYAVLLVLAASLLGELAQRFFSPTNLVMFYLLAVVVAAGYLGRGPSIVVAIMSVVVFDFFLVPPRFTLAVSDTEYLFTFLALLIVGLVISNLAVLTREQAEDAERRAAQNAELYSLSRDLAVAGDLDTIVQAVLEHVSQTFNGQAAVFLPADEGIAPLRLVASSPGLVPGEHDLDIAARAFHSSQPVGLDASAGRQAQDLFVPLRTSRGVIGVLSARPAGLPTGPGLLAPELRQLLDAFASQAALAIERARLAEQAQQTEVLQAAERLQSALLNSISHDLRTPLVSIIGALSSLQEDDAELDSATRHSLLDNALGEADRLNRLVGNLLDMTRIEAGALRLRRESCDVEDLIGAAMEQLAPHLPRSRVQIEVLPEMPLVPIDFVLMEQVLVNLLDNALKYSPDGAPIQLRAWVEGNEACFEVADRGVGIPAADLSRVFDKFFRVHQPGSVSGTGLGLAICKGIVEAHGGRLWVQNRDGGGTLADLVLPLAHKNEG